MVVAATSLADTVHLGYCDGIIEFPDPVTAVGDYFSLFYQHRASWVIAIVLAYPGIFPGYPEKLILIMVLTQFG